MATRPINEPNAISEVVFVLQLGIELSPDVIEGLLQSLEEVLKPVFPRVDRVQRFSFALEDPHKPSKQTAAVELGGLDFKRFSLAGSVEWMLRIHPGFISANCLSYTRWDKVWSSAYRYLRTVAENVISKANPINSIGLQYIDRFIYEGQDEDYSLEELFSRSSVFLTSHAFDSGSLWHVNQGWFEDIGQTGRCLNVLNVAANMVGNTHQTTIDHQANLQLHESCTDYRRLFGESLEKSSIAVSMGELHLRNKEVLKALVLPAMATRIGLVG